MTTASPNPNDHAEAYSVIVLAGTTSPGLATVEGAALTNRWEEKEGDGQDGDSTTLKGRKNAHFSVSFELWDDPASGRDDFAAWDIFVGVLKLSTKVEPLAALDIYHPELARLDIGAVQVEEIGQVKYDGLGGGTVVVKFLEFRPPKPKSGTPGGSKGPGAGAAGGGADGEGSSAPDPNADAKAELEAELAKAREP